MKASILVKKEERSGEISPYIYGQYFEHLGNCMYPSVWNADSPKSDARGLRQDVIEAARELGVPVIRWPGGCYVDLYDWKDGVGPSEQRPVRPNWHWGGLESNQFGTDEFLNWCEQVGADPYVNVNLGTGTLVDALRWIDYCNGKETADARWRKENGREEPYGVKLWGIGNETWGHWEAGQLGADEYAARLANWAQFAKKYDEQLELLGVGSYEGNDSEWDRKVIEAAGKYLRYLTIHIYGCSVDRQSNEEYYPIVYTPVYFESQLRKMLSTIETTLSRMKDKLGHPIRISLDEWNIRHYEADPSSGEGYTLNRNSPRNLQDAIFAAGIFHAMIRLSPHVGMANYVFLVNGNGVMNVTEDAVIKTPLFHLFKKYREWMVGQSVQIEVQSPSRLTPVPQVSHPNYGKEQADKHQPVASSYIDAVGAVGDDGSLRVALVNRHLDESFEIALGIPEGFASSAAVWTLHHENIHAANTEEAPERVVPDVREFVPVEAGLRVPAHSVTLIRFESIDQ
ncbi:alpha-L-arabinofuranosidase C-terminal domain-containing protein [Paenibacillus nasutitermitis]|uniref:non-reducing end alpha-L-arabinofuranosidase n=1 Tax=Paenibacillus nasutitermitis TaxID=1652958 RepID=A0A916ZDX1_9BACL|nr:alpha-L-arabinofuranosidase C-terminal domain-containing protein [Paenibacillus nasutitermitis]GGD90866.1 alpha-N-arabinofuranosidase [Paenibacillus nasutitermitis]